MDGIIFTAGIGERSAEIRELYCLGLDELGIVIDLEKKSTISAEMREINSPDSKVKIVVILTNEELKIAQEIKRVIESG